MTGSAWGFVWRVEDRDHVHRVSHRGAYKSRETEVIPNASNPGASKKARHDASTSPYDQECDEASKHVSGVVNMLQNERAP